MCLNKYASGWWRWRGCLQSAQLGHSVRSSRTQWHRKKKDVRVATFTFTVLQSQRDIVTAVENLTQEVHKIIKRNYEQKLWCHLFMLCNYWRILFCFRLIHIRLIHVLHPLTISMLVGAGTPLRCALTLIIWHILVINKQKEKKNRKNRKRKSKRK